MSRRLPGFATLCSVIRVGMKAITDVLHMIGGALASVVTLPFRALARLFGGASRVVHRR